MLSPQRRQLLHSAAGLIISVIFLAIVFRHTTWDDIVAHMRGIRYSFVFLAILNKGFGFVVLAIRWNTLLKRIHHYSFRDVLRGVLYGFTLNNLLPFRIGEFFRIEYIAERG